MFPAGAVNAYGVPLTAGDQLREASDRLKRLQATAAGPPTLKDSITVGCHREAVSMGLRGCAQATVFGRLCSQQCSQCEFKQQAAA